MRQSLQKSTSNQYANRFRIRMTLLIFARGPSVEIHLCRVYSYIKLSRSHKSACLAGRLSSPLVRSCGLQHSSRCEMICSESVLEWIPVMVSMEVSRSNGIPCPSQWCDRCEIRLPWNLGQSSSFPFFGRRKIGVDVDLIDDTSCLHGAISNFQCRKTDPSKIQPLMGALSKPGEPCPGQCSDRCEVRLPLYLGQSNAFPIFFARKQYQCRCRSHW